MTTRELHGTERRAVMQIMDALGVLRSLHNPHRVVTDDPRGLRSGADTFRQFSPGVMVVFPGELRADAARSSRDAYQARRKRRPA